MTNYTVEQTEYIKKEYLADPTRDTVDRLAEELSKTPKSIIGKLSREKVYRRTVYTTKTGEKPIRKVEIVANIAELLDLDLNRLGGLDKSPKNVLKMLEERLKELGKSAEEGRSGENYSLE